MITNRMLWVSMLSLAAALSTMSVSADTAEAMCKVYQRGDAKHGKSGPCDFAQRQGYVRIDLRNGESWDLSPTNRANEFRDQEGRKVTRSFEGDEQVYKWPHATIFVAFPTSSGRDDYRHGDRQAHGSATHGVPPMPYSTREYSATSYFRCSMGSPTHDQSCPAGIRRGERGSASIRIRRPDGRERVLDFRNGDVTTPGPGRLTWGKDGDEWYIGIDDREFYIVPDAAIWGG